MAHFAQVNKDNIVVNVVVIDNNDCLDSDGNESEQVGIDFCKSLFDVDSEYVWVQTSYNRSFRANYAGVDYTYDVDTDRFIPPCPSEDCIFDDEKCWWVAPPKNK